MRTIGGVFASTGITDITIIVPPEQPPIEEGLIINTAVTMTHYQKVAMSLRDA
jgi:hypothetical protein